MRTFPLTPKLRSIIQIVIIWAEEYNLIYMHEDTKQSILEKARGRVARVRAGIQQRKKELAQKTTQEVFHQALRLKGDAQAVALKLFEHSKKRTEELSVLYPSPYFVRCDVQFDDKDELEQLYFGKFPYTEEFIYSWTAEAARIRFENPGIISYTRTDGSIRTGTLLRKDQYMIADGKIVFLSSESQEYSRELIYQEHFSTQKKDFVLPEIVAQMEKAQDQVIRAHHKGPFAISGPAGSGKTTLALHRVGYLVQSPETSELYPTHELIVFVQDAGAKDYFSQLLPSLGIHEVTITTFFEWAQEIIGAESYNYVHRYGNTEQERDHYEYAKAQAVATEQTSAFNKRNIFAVLKEAYASVLSPHERAMLAKQQKEKVLDRFDVTLLLKSFKQTYGELSKITDYYEEDAKGTLKKKTGNRPVIYPLIVVDEFQNYIPSQITLLKSTLKESTNAIIYVGDLRQQTQFGGLKRWSDIAEDLAPERDVALHKIYRNTKQILTFIQSLGYTVDIATGVKEGEPVVEKICETKAEEITYITNCLQNLDQASVAIIGKNQDDLDECKKAFKEYKNVHVLTMYESQGLEFEAVFLVGIKQHMFASEHTEHKEAFVAEQQRINKDLLYVALTRAISELHVLGTETLKNISL